MSSFQIIVGSMLGGSEYVAEACEETLNNLGHEVTVHLLPEFSKISVKNQIWLICTSTHGAGDYPDNIQKFVTDLTSCNDDLSSLKFLTIGIGDSNYDTYCYAANNINNLLLSKNCKEIIKLKKYDMSKDIDPEEEAQLWITTNKDLL